MQQTVDHTKTSLRMLTSTMVSNTGGKIANARQILERLPVASSGREVTVANNASPIQLPDRPVR
jgi:hypothetical protein